MLEVAYLPHDPRLPGVLQKLQTIKYIRTVVTTLLLSHDAGPSVTEV